jgi:hypothetical protein
MAAPPPPTLTDDLQETGGELAEQLIDRRQPPRPGGAEIRRDGEALIGIARALRVRVVPEEKYGCMRKGIPHPRRKGPCAPGALPAPRGDDGVRRALSWRVPLIRRRGRRAAQSLEKARRVTLRRV